MYYKEKIKKFLSVACIALSISGICLSLLYGVQCYRMYNLLNELKAFQIVLSSTNTDFTVIDYKNGSDNQGEEK